MKVLRCLMWGCVALVSTHAAFAHHSTAEFDYRKTVMLTGKVTEVQWKNPHSFLIIAVPDGKGRVTQWAIETGTPNVNVRMGWRKDSVKVGDDVTLNIAPTRDGTSRGTLRILTFANGRQLRGVAAQVSADKNGFAVFGPPAADPAGPEKKQ
jgi:Family of unknown function (DUF6152)